MRLIIMMITALLLTGCAARGTLVWQHSQGYDDTRLEADRKDCLRLAQREVRYPYFYYNDPFFPFYPPFPYHGRYYYPGNTLWYDHFQQVRYQDELNRLFHLCMEAKGWHLVRIPAPEQ